MVCDLFKMFCKFGGITKFANIKLRKFSTLYGMQLLVRIDSKLCMGLVSRVSVCACMHV